MQPSFEFPLPLSEKYRPRQIADFAGLSKPKQILTKFAANPRPISFTFAGESGTGKTSMALCLAETIGAELHHVGSQEATLDRLQRICYTCSMMPMRGYRFHLVLIDEAHKMSSAAQDYLLSKLDSTEPVPLTLFVMTTTEKDRIQTPLLSRTIQLEFSNYGIQSEAAELLTRVWESEAQGSPAPNVARIIKEACGNVRESLMRLQTELLLA